MVLDPLDFTIFYTVISSLIGSVLNMVTFFSGLFSALPSWCLLIFACSIVLTMLALIIKHVSF